MRAYYFFNKIINSSLVAFIISSILIFFAEIFSLVSSIGDNGFLLVLSDLADLLIALVPYVFGYFITISISKRDRNYRAFFILLCLAVFSAIIPNDVNILFSIVFTFGANYIFNSFNKIIAYSSVLIIAVILAFIDYYLIDYIYDFQMLTAELISHSKGFSSFLFGALSSIFNSLTTHSFDELFYYRSYGGSLIVNEELITGIKDMIENGYNGTLVSKYMSGHYYLLFALIGVALSMADELKGSQRATMLISFILGVISGDLRLVLLFIFLESPYLSFVIILLSGVCYTVADMLDIVISFVYNGGVIELIKNISSPVYLISGGLVFTAIGFFLTKLIHTKHGLSDCYNIYIPSRLNAFVNSLGGIVNIVKIDNNVLEVRNPKLINTFNLDCDIKENLVKLDDKRLNDLKEYLE